MDVKREMKSENDAGPSNAAMNNQNEKHPTNAIGVDGVASVSTEVVLDVKPNVDLENEAGPSNAANRSQQDQVNAGDVVDAVLQPKQELEGSARQLTFGMCYFI